MTEKKSGSNPKSPYRFRLGAQLLAILCAIATIVAVSSSYLVSHGEKSYIVALMDNEHDQKLELLVAVILDNLISEDVPQIETSMTQLIRRDPYVRWLKLENEKGKILFRYPKDGRTVMTDSRNYRVFKKEIVYQGENFGRFTAVWDTEPIVEAGKSRAFDVAVLIGVICLFLGALFYIFIRIFMISPVQEISGEVNRIQNGDYGTASCRRPHGFVATEIHNMAASVAALRHHLVQRKIYEAELEMAKQTAEQASRAKSEFLANVSHELRTPLNAIIGFSEMIKLEVFGKIGDERYLSYIRDINGSGEHLLELINDILDISRIEAGKLELKREPIDIGDAIRSGITLVQPMLNEKTIDLEIRIPDDLSEVFADSQRVQQIAINLLSNAAKFTGSGGRVSLSVHRDGDGDIVITIADTGIGIAPDDLEKIVRPFEQVENSFTRQHAGSGLGLPIAVALIEMHGGTLRIQSVVGEGTEVTVTLPQGRAGADAASADSADAGGDSGGSEFYRHIA